VVGGRDAQALSRQVAEFVMPQFVAVIPARKPKASPCALLATLRKRYTEESRLGKFKSVRRLKSGGEQIITIEN